MKKTIGMAALGGLAMACGTASASLPLIEDLCVNLSFAENTLWVGESTTATLTASWDGPAGSYLSLVNIDLFSSSDQIAISNLQTVVWNQPASGLSGTADSVVGSDIFGLGAAQLSMLGSVNSANPIVITTFTVTAIGVVNDLFFTAQVGPHGSGPFAVNHLQPLTPATEFGIEAFKSERLTLVPSTGVLSIAGVCGLAGLRRRR